MRKVRIVPRLLSIMGALLFLFAWTPLHVFADHDDDETKIRIHEGHSVVIICNDHDFRADYLHVVDTDDDSARLRCRETQYRAHNAGRPNLMNYQRHRGWHDENTWQRWNGWQWGRFSYEDDQQRVRLDPGESITLKCRNARKTDLESQRYGPRVVVFTCER